MTSEIFVIMALDAWQGQLNATNALLDKLSDEQLMQEVSPSKNRGIYLLGHLAAVHDLMLPLLRFREPIHPELHPVFVDAPDRATDKVPFPLELRAEWKEVNEVLANYISSLPASEWFTRHAKISEEDFKKEPLRNRLNVLLSRTSHLSYHRGQLVLLVKK